jgi:hypothetical protein
MGVVKSVNPFALSMGMSINCGLAGLTFFGMSPDQGDGQGHVLMATRNERVPRQPCSDPHATYE